MGRGNPVLKLALMLSICFAVALAAEGATPMEEADRAFAAKEYKKAGTYMRRAASVGVNRKKENLKCQAFRNRNYGGGIYNCVSDISLTNTIVWDNSASGSGNQIALRYASELSAEFNNIQGGQAQIYSENSTINWGSGNIDLDPAFKDASNVAGADGVFRTWDDGLVVHKNDEPSPCVDAANGHHAGPVDVIGRRRFNNIHVTDTGTGLPVFADMGAYEGPYDASVVSFCIIDETYYHTYRRDWPADGAPDFFADLDDFRQLKNCLAVVKARCIVPKSAEPETLGEIDDVLPFCYTPDPQSPPEGIYLEQFGDDPDVFPTNQDMVNSFNDTRDGIAPQYHFVSVDDSTSMNMDDIWPTSDSFDDYVSAVQSQAGCANTDVQRFKFPYEENGMLKSGAKEKWIEELCYRLETELIDP